MQAVNDCRTLRAVSPQTYSLAQRLGDLLLRRNATVTTAESCTGGGVAHAITAVAGSSQWFEAGFVTYANRIKHQLLDVETSTLESYGAVSEPVVIQMARSALGKAKATVAVAVSGIAGPDGGSDDKPVGTVWFAWAYRDGTVTTESCLFVGDRASVRDQSVDKALSGLLDMLHNKIE